MATGIGDRVRVWAGSVGNKANGQEEDLAAKRIPTPQEEQAKAIDVPDEHA
jgi:hypothetical protein